MVKPGKKQALASPSIQTAGNPVLRVLGTGVTLIDPIKQRAEEDLGIELKLEVLDGVATQAKAVMQPASYDVYDQWFHSVELLWLSGAIQPIEIDRLPLWGEVNSLAKEGRLTPEARFGYGDNPVDRLYVHPGRGLGREPNGTISMLPGAHNVDSFAYNLEEVPAGVPYETESWGWLLDDKWRGKAALVDDPAIGVIDAALAAEAQGLMEFADIGNMTLKEIDRLIDILLEKEKAGHFGAFWKSFAEADELMASRQVVIESMWSPSVMRLKGRGIPVRYAAPREGYRAWQSGMGISSRTKGRTLDIAYEYLNWWMSGWPGATMARQGYYYSIPDRAREHLSDDEWSYWYMGEKAATDLSGPDGAVVVRAGESRDGGSYWQRFANIGVWNSIMDEHNYLVRRWHKLTSFGSNSA
jgi:putative spermidine/putrescine transport system substrate-binding protein